MTEVQIRDLREPDLDAADRIMRVAFGTFLGAPEPEAVFGDADHVHSRFPGEHTVGFCAEYGGEVVGSNIATRWGSFGFFGPLTVRPDLWDRGVASRLMEPVVAQLDGWGLSQAGLFTFGHSQRHVGLYQKFGFWPGPLTALLGKAPAATDSDFTTFEAAGETRGRDAVLGACRELTGAVFPGLDLGPEIEATEAQGLGTTLLLEDGDRVTAVAVCHIGAGTEAGSGSLFVKFGAVLPGENADERFGRLLDACETVAAERGLENVLAGGDSGRHHAYRSLVDRGYRAQMIGVKMFRPAGLGYSRPEVFAIDDLR